MSICTTTYANKIAQSNLETNHVELPTGYVDRHPNLTTCLILGAIQPTIPNRIHIRSAIFPQCTGQTDKQINTWLEGMSDDYRLLSLYREQQHGLIMVLLAHMSLLPPPNDIFISSAIFARLVDVNNNHRHMVYTMYYRHL